MSEDKEMLDLLSRPLTEGELAQFQDVLSSDDFQDMIQMYHANAAIEAVRKLILGFFDQGLELESMIILLGNVWLDCVSEFDSRIDKASLDIWRQLPVVLTQIMVQNALLELVEKREQGTLKEDYAPELEELYEHWSQVTPILRRTPLPEATQAQQEHLAEILYGVTTDFRKKLTQESGLKLQTGNYLEIWTMLLMQTYLFGYGDEPVLYYLIEANWPAVRGTLANMLDLMSVLKGMESMLLPENRHQLNNMIADGEFSPN